MKKVTGLIIAAIVLALGWFLVSPLFIDRTVDEPFVFTTETGGLDLDAVMEMPEEKRQEMRDEIMAIAASEADTEATEEMPTEPRMIAGGMFVDADAVHRGTGTASLYALPDGSHVVRFEDFKVTNGPDLYVYLAKHPDPKSADDVTDGGFVSLGKLKGNIGNQNYVIPDDVNVDDYGSVVVWCQLFGVLFSPAAFTNQAT